MRENDRVKHTVNKNMRPLGSVNGLTLTKMNFNIDRKIDGTPIIAVISAFSSRMRVGDLFLAGEESARGADNCRHDARSREPDRQARSLMVRHILVQKNSGTDRCRLM